jgi:FMN-dependent NADH-azoreductase
MTLLRIDASIRIDGSVSRELADTAELAWAAEHPGAAVVRRDLGTTPLPAGSWPAAISAALAPDAPRTPEQLAAGALVSALGDELLAADAVLVSTPLYNFGVSQHLKAWLDLMLADPRVGPPAQQPLSGTPLILAMARGGGYGPGTPREGWDHATPWLHRIFGDVLGMDVHLAAAELTLADVTPEMEELRGLAAESRRTAQVTAAEHGAKVAAALTADTAA